jgi:7-carboxy-7-deazaguanine synthase
MFGQNIKRSVFKGDGTLLQIKKIFLTLQGEGIYAGIPAVFIRLGGCNLACSFCDTDFENDALLHIDEILSQVIKYSAKPGAKRSVNLVVITGGEPLRQPINLLCQLLLQQNYKVQIESNGTLFTEMPKQVEVICSPKVIANKYTKIHQALLPHLIAIKFLISSTEITYSNVPVNILPSNDIPILVQPMDEFDEKINRANQELAIKLALENGYRLSYQIHKILNIE